MTLFEGPVVAVGKIAGEAEFLRAETDAGALFDAWLDEGFEAGFERWGGDWGGVVRAGSPYAFVWWPPHVEGTEGPLCGVLAPSRDAVGRDYPLAAFAQVRTGAVERAPHVLLLALGEFLDQVWRVVDLARATPVTRSELAFRLGELPLPREKEVIRAATEYAEWCRTAPLGDGWRSILLTDEGVAPADVIAAITQTDADGLVRLPVGDGGAGAVALWTDVTARVRGDRDAHSVFWSPDDRSLLVGSGPPPIATIGTLWAPESLAPVNVQAPAGSFAGRNTANEVRSDASMAEFLTLLAGPRTC